MATTATGGAEMIIAAPPVGVQIFSQHFCSEAYAPRLLTADTK
jgi:hypothetical protein